MFSSSVAGGSICLRCQLRAVTRRAIPAVAAAQIRGRKRQYASEAARTDSQEDELEAVLRNQRHDESRQQHRYSSAWTQKTQPQKTGSVERRTCPHCLRVFDTKHLMHSHRDGGSCPAGPAADQSSSQEKVQGADEHGSSVERLPAAAPGSRSYESDEPPRPEAGEGADQSQVVRRTYNSRASARETGKEAKKKYRRGNMSLEADASRLTVNTLGKPAEVIVLRDRGAWKRKVLPVIESPEEADQISLAIEEFLHQEEGGLGVDSLLRYIHGLKPEHRVLSAREFKSLFQTLLGGFTSLQLEYYVEWHRTGQPLEENENEGQALDEEDVISEDDVTPEGTTASEDATVSEQPSETEDVAANEDQTPPSSLLDKPEPYPWMAEQAHWSPELPGAVEETEYPLRGYILKSMRPKERLVVQLMRECWDVSAQELMDGNGRMDVRVRDLEFRLLTLGNQRWLHKISRIFLKQGKQMEVIRSQNLIRIVAPKVVAETCLSALDETCQKIKTKSFKLHQVPMKHLDAGILAELGNITNSVVEFSSSHEEIQVSWIDIRDDESRSKLEDLGDVIFRLLLTAHTSASTINTVAIYPEVEGKGRFIEDFGDKSKLSWIDRRRDWARLCLPLAPGKPSTAKVWPLATEILKYKIQPSAEDLTLPTSTLKSKIDAIHGGSGFDRLPEGGQLETTGPPREQPGEQEPGHARGPAPTKPTISGWLPFKVSTNAVFGHILHERSPGLTRALSQPATALANQPRALSPLIPPIANMNLPGWVPYNQPAGGVSTILMRFVPYDVDHADAAAPQAPGAPPHLELRLHATDGGAVSAHSLRATGQTCVSDVLLPAEHVDVRSTQRLYAELPGPAIDAAAGMAPLAEFLRASRLEPGRGELVTPPRLRGLGLPQWLVRGPPAPQAASPSSSPADTPETPAAPSDNALVATSYVFAGLEVHRSLETTYDGWRLVYTSVEAGQGGGRRAELSLEAVPGYDRGLRRGARDVDTASFLRSVYQLARGLRGAAVEGPDGEDVSTTISWVDRDWAGV